MAQYVAATVSADEGSDTNALLEQANTIGLTPEELQRPTEQPPVALAEPQPGTYERFMGSFGSPRRWAGR